MEGLWLVIEVCDETMYNMFEVTSFNIIFCYKEKLKVESIMEL